QCFLFQDIASALAVGFVGNDRDGRAVQQAPAERARTAFAWVIRQVLLFGTPDPRQIDGAEPPVPPEFTARRGGGTALERALVFLALIQEMHEAEGNLRGCLLTIRDKADAPARLWACGVVADGSADVLLFDPVLGLPLPGKDGKGVAT